MLCIDMYDHYNNVIMILSISTAWHGPQWITPWTYCRYTLIIYWFHINNMHSQIYAYMAWYASISTVYANYVYLAYILYNNH